MPSVLITGTSSGIGRAAVLHFQQQGWQVAATLRSPEQETELGRLPNVRLLRLDVTDAASVQGAVAEAIAAFGQLDAVVNNAGYGLSGPFEAQTEADIRRQFETNVFGLMAVCRAALPHLRQRRQGVLINVASMGGRLAVPLYSTYHATKWAVDGFSESLQYELAPLGIRVKIIEPGAIRTDFYSRSAVVADSSALPDYAAYTARVTAAMNASGASGTAPERVAEAIFRAATDGSSRLRYVVGMDAQSALFIRRLIPHSWFRAFIRSATKS